MVWFNDESAAALENVASVALPGGAVAIEPHCKT
jgi:hypothetical protein